MAPSEHSPVLIVIAGPNGSGKTSVTSKILHHITRPVTPFFVISRIILRGLCTQKQHWIAKDGNSVLAKFGNIPMTAAASAL